MNLKRNKTDIVVIVVSLLLIIAVSVTSIIISNNNRSNNVNIYYENRIVYSMKLNVNELWTMEKKKYPALQADILLHSELFRANLLYFP